MISQAFHILRFPILVFFVNVLFDGGGIYQAVLWLDMPMHFLGGASIAVAGAGFLALLQKHGFLRVIPFPLWIFLIVSFVGLAAVVWELGEFSVDLLFKKDLQGDRFDTMMDMFFGLAGGFVTSIIWRYRKLST